MSKVTNDDLLPSTTAAAIIKRDVRTLHRYVHEGRITPAIQASGIRGARFFRRSDVEALAAEINKQAS